MDGADVCGTSSRASRRPPNVTCGAAILDPRWRRRKWHQPGLGASFSIPIEGEVQNGDPSASGGHLGWPHLRNRKWGHPRWPPEAEGPPFCTSPSMGIEKLALYYSWVQPDCQLGISGMTYYKLVTDLVRSREGEILLTKIFLLKYWCFYSGVSL